MYMEENGVMGQSIRINNAAHIRLSLDPAAAAPNPRLRLLFFLAAIMNGFLVECFVAKRAPIAAFF